MVKVPQRKPVPSASPTGLAATSRTPTLPPYPGGGTFPVSTRSSWDRPPSYTSAPATRQNSYGSNSALPDSDDGTHHKLSAPFNPLAFDAQKASTSVPTLESVTHRSGLHKVLHRKAAPENASIGAPIDHRLVRHTERRLCTFDMSEGIRTPTMGPLPPMDAHITFNDTAILKGPDSRTARAIRGMEHRASQALQAAKSELKSALESFDAQIKLRLNGREPTKQELETFHAMCGNILRSQEAKVEQLVQNMWDMELKRDKSLGSSKIKFGVAIGFKAVKLSGSITSAVMAPNPLSVAAACYTAVQMAEVAKSYFKGRDKALSRLERNDALLGRLYNEGEHGLKRTGLGAMELVGATHIPLTHGLPTLQHHAKEIEEFLAKSERMRPQIEKWEKELAHTREQLHDHSSHLEAALKEGNIDAASYQERMQATRAMEGHLQRLEMRIQDMHAVLQADNDRYLYFSQRLSKRFREEQLPGAKGMATAVSTSALGADLAYVSYNVAKLAPYLAV